MKDSIEIIYLGLLEGWYRDHIFRFTESLKDGIEIIYSGLLEGWYRDHIFRFTESLKDGIEIALDQGDEDMSTVSIGKLFLQSSSMLGAFKSYCTRQVTIANM